MFEPDDRRYRREVKSHVTQHPLPVVTWQGRRVTHPFRTFVDLAGWIAIRRVKAARATPRIALTPAQREELEELINQTLQDAGLAEQMQRLGESLVLPPSRPRLEHPGADRAARSRWGWATR